MMLSRPSCWQQQRRMLAVVAKSITTNASSPDERGVVARHFSTLQNTTNNNKRTQLLQATTDNGNKNQQHHHVRAYSTAAGYTNLTSKIYSLRLKDLPSVPLASYSTSPILGKDDKGSDVVVMNSTMSKEEAEKILEEELAKMKKEKEDKIIKNWKPGQRKRPLMISYRLEDFEYELDPDAPPKWTNRDKRCGALAIKVGMMPVWDEWGERHPCTVLWMDQNVVMGHKTPDKHGYLALQVAAGERKQKRVSGVVLGQYQHLPILQEHPPFMVREFRITDEEQLIPVGTQLHASHFVPGQNLDIAGITKGKGFQGPMKRHHFSGMPASHGTSKTHRAHGATGSRQDPGKVFKGKKMAGHMGVDRRTIQNLRLVKIDRGRNLLFVRGAVPGNKGCFVEVKDAVKRPLWNSPLVLDKLDRPPLPTAKYDPKIDGSGKRGKEVFMPMLQSDPLNPTAPPGDMPKATAVAAAAAAAAKSSN